MKKWAIIFLAALIAFGVVGYMAAAQPHEEANVDPVTALVAGGVVGYVIGQNGQPQPVDLNKLIAKIRESKPINYEVITLDASTARENALLPKAGNFIVVDSYDSPVEFKVRLNEQSNGEINLNRHPAIEGVFYQIFVTNPAGPGQIRLLIGRGLNIQPASTSITLEELAARLGSINTFDRRGEVIWMDDFEDNINKWNQTALGTGASIALSTEQANSGNKSAKLIAGSDGLRSAQIDKYLGYSALSKYGFEAVINIGSTAPQYFTYNIIFEDVSGGGSSYYGSLRYTVATQTMAYQALGGAWINLSPTVGLPAFNSLFHHFKLVVDGVNKTYVRAIVNNKSWELSNAPLAQSLVVSDKLTATIYVLSNSGQNGVIYVDDAIVTQKEP